MYKYLRHGFSLSLLLPTLAVWLPAQITQWPTTVAPGRFLLEMDALSLTLDHEPGFKYTAWGAASTLLTTGLNDHLDLQLGADLYISQRIETSGFTERKSGVGAMRVRTKWRFYDENGVAVAIMPYVKIPTNGGGVGNNSLEGGVIVPWSADLPTGFKFAAMAELDFLRNDNDDGYDTHWYASAAFSRPIMGPLGIYGEATLAKSTGSGSAKGVMGGGATLAVNDSVWWDYALYKGISTAAPDWHHVLRLNIKF
jgi:hypothetical protein